MSTVTYLVTAAVLMWGIIEGLTLVATARESHNER